MRFGGSRGRDRRPRRSVCEKINIFVGAIHESPAQQANVTSAVSSSSGALAKRRISAYSPDIIIHFFSRTVGDAGPYHVNPYNYSLFIFHYSLFISFSGRRGRRPLPREPPNLILRFGEPLPNYSFFIIHFFLGSSRRRSIQIFNKKSRAKIALLFKLMRVYYIVSSLLVTTGSSTTPFERYATCLSVIMPRAFSVPFTVMPEV